MLNMLLMHELLLLVYRLIAYILYFSLVYLCYQDRFS